MSQLVLCACAGPVCKRSVHPPPHLHSSPPTSRPAPLTGGASCTIVEAAHVVQQRSCVHPQAPTGSGTRCPPVSIGARQPHAQLTQLRTAISAGRSRSPSRRLGAITSAASRHQQERRVPPLRWRLPPRRRCLPGRRRRWLPRGRPPPFLRQRRPWLPLPPPQQPS